MSGEADHGRLLEGNGSAIHETNTKIITRTLCAR
jgi:hypothetical protein